MPLQIQYHHFEFLVLVVDILDEYDFIIGLEAAIQLEAVYHMTSHVFNVQPRSVPLFPKKDIKTSPGTSTSIQLFGDLPCSFTSGTAIIQVQPIEAGYSFNTIEVKFLNQSTCIHISNKSQEPVYLCYTYVTSFAVMQDASNHRLENIPTHVMDTKDPYP